MELAADLTPDGLRDVLAELGDRVAPISLARERILPVHPAITTIFPDGGLVRGRVHACSGSGGSTMAMTMAGHAVIDGGWLALVDVATFGADAADELGIPLERVVRISTGPLDGEVPGGDAESARRWLDVMAAAIDGFDVVIATVPTSMRQGTARSLVARLQQRGAVVIVLGAPGALPVDVEISSVSTCLGLGQGHGVIGRRRLVARSTGRRQAAARSCVVDLAVAGRRVELAAAVSSAAPALVSVAALSPVEGDGQGALDPSEQVIAEMVEHGDEPPELPIRLAAG